MSAGLHHLNANSLVSEGMAPSPSPIAKTKWECTLGGTVWSESVGNEHTLQAKPTVPHHVRPRGLIDEVSRDWGWAAGLEDVRAHAPVLPFLRLPVTSLVHKALLSGDWVPPLVKPQWLVTFVFSACKTKHRCYSNCGRFHQRTHTCSQFTERSAAKHSSRTKLKKKKKHK